MVDRELAAPRLDFQRLCDGQEYQEDQLALEVTDVEINQTVNLFGCKNTTVIVKGKANAVTLSK
jgi:hypothetical protein